MADLVCPLSMMGDGPKLCCSSAVGCVTCPPRQLDEIIEEVGELGRFLRARADDARDAQRGKGPRHRKPDDTGPPDASSQI